MAIKSKTAGDSRNEREALKRKVNKILGNTARLWRGRNLLREIRSIGSTQLGADLRRFQAAVYAIEIHYTPPSEAEKLLAALEKARMRLDVAKRKCAAVMTALKILASEHRQDQRPRKQFACYRAQARYYANRTRANKEAGTTKQKGQRGARSRSIVEPDYGFIPGESEPK